MIRYVIGVKEYVFAFVLILCSLFVEAQTVSEIQQQNARATGYAIIAAKNPGKQFAVLVIPWDGVHSLEYNANNQINSNWHAQAAVKGNYFDQAFDGSNFTAYSSVILSEADFDTYKFTGTNWWIVCSNLPPFSSSLSNNLKLDEYNVRLWSLVPSGGNLSLTSGDGYGNFSIGSTGAPEKLSVNGKVLAEGLKLNENGVRQWSMVPNGGNLSFETGDGEGFVGIGTANPKEKLSVNGKIRAKEIKVEIANWPDYVFENTYKAPSLLEIETYIKANKRLPEMPSAKEVEANGVELGEMNKLLLKKVEELTLLLIDQNKKNEKQEQAIDELRKELEKVKTKK